MYPGREREKGREGGREEYNPKYTQHRNRDDRRHFSPYSRSSSKPASSWRSPSVISSAAPSFSSSASSYRNYRIPDQNFKSKRAVNISTRIWMEKSHSSTSRNSQSHPQYSSSHHKIEKVEKETIKKKNPGILMKKLVENFTNFFKTEKYNHQNQLRHFELDFQMLGSSKFNVDLNGKVVEFTDKSDLTTVLEKLKTEFKELSSTSTTENLLIKYVKGLKISMKNSKGEISEMPLLNCIRGVTMTVTEKNGILIYEYTPTWVKKKGQDILDLAKWFAKFSVSHFHNFEDETGQRWRWLEYYPCLRREKNQVERKFLELQRREIYIPISTLPFDVDFFEVERAGQIIAYFICRHVAEIQMTLQRIKTAMGFFNNHANADLRPFDNIQNCRAENLRKLYPEDKTFLNHLKHAKFVLIMEGQHNRFNFEREKVLRFSTDIPTIIQMLEHRDCIKLTGPEISLILGKPHYHLQRDGMSNQDINNQVARKIFDQLLNQNYIENQGNFTTKAVLTQMEDFQYEFTGYFTSQTVSERTSAKKKIYSILKICESTFPLIVKREIKAFVDELEGENPLLAAQFQVCSTFYTNEGTNS